MLARRKAHKDNKLPIERAVFIYRMHDGPMKWKQRSRQSCRSHSPNLVMNLEIELIHLSHHSQSRCGSVVENINHF